jgi:hypothetical protein
MNEEKSMIHRALILGICALSNVGIAMDQMSAEQLKATYQKVEEIRKIKHKQEKTQSVSPAQRATPRRIDFAKGVRCLKRALDPR